MNMGMLRTLLQRAGSWMHDALLAQNAEGDRPFWMVSEVPVLTLIVLAGGIFISPDDPLFTHANVPWSWVAPVLLALRYGVLSGLASMALLLGAWALLAGAGDPLPTQVFIGGLLLTMVCGEFSGSWRGRVDRLAEVNSYLEDRIERVTGRLFTVQRSHDLLQQELLQRPTTLRHSLDGLERRALVAEQSVATAAQAFLDHLAASCQLEDAQVMAYDAHGGRPGAVLARLGESAAVVFDDPLVQYALQYNRLGHVQVGLPDGPMSTRYLVVAPLRIGRQEIPALLVVARMPFLALHDETLQMIAVLCSAFSSAAQVSESVATVLSYVKQCPLRLAEELSRLDRIARDHAIVSQVVLLRFDDPLRSEELVRMAQRRARAPDVNWAYVNSHGCHRLLTLMPLASSAAVEGYLARFTEIVVGRYRAEVAAPSLAGLLIGVRVLTLGGDLSLGEALQHLIAEEDVA
jgi:polysaccharide biosynthesis protein PelD